jgi:hypothetical protein
MLKKYCLGVVCTLALSGVASGESITVPKCTKAPIIDGKLNDACWQSGKWTGGFKILNMPADKAQQQTRFKLTHDNTNLYLAAELDEPLTRKLKADVVKRDGAIWRDDSLEIFLDTNNDKTTYFHFGINARGTVFDETRRQGGHVSSPLWNSKATRAATQVKPGKWIVEMSIPMVDLNLDKANKGNWGFNIARSRYAGKSNELSTFSPLNGGFQQPAKFAKLKLKNADLSRYFWKIRPIYSDRTTRQNGKLSYSCKTYIFNDTGKFKFTKVRAFFVDHSSSTEIVNKGFSEGTGKEIDVILPAKSNGNNKLVIQVTDRRSGNIIASHMFDAVIDFAPLSISVTSPGYRNSIYATQKLNHIKGIISSSLSASELNDSVLSLKFLDKDNKKLYARNIDNVKLPFKYTIPCSSLKTGKYFLKAALQRNGKVLYSAKAVISKLPPVANEVRINAKRVTLVNGKPFLPYGWFSINKVSDWPTLSKFGYNSMQDYNAYYRNDKALKKWLDDAQAAGLKVLIYPYPKRSYNNKERWMKPLSAQEEAAIRSFINKWKSHPALLGWYMADEPELRPALPARMKAIYDVIVEEDPFHPAVLLNDTIRGIHTYGQYCDVLMPDPYPLFLNDADAAQPIEKVGKFVTEMNGIAGKGMWITPQGFNYGDYGRKNNRAPNFRELRNMQYQAVQGGVTGFIWYTYYKSRQYPSCVYGINFLAQEAQLLKNVILNSNRKKLKTSDKKLNAVFYSNINGHQYLIVVNNNTTPQKAKISLPTRKNIKWYVVSEKRSCFSKNGVLMDSFKKYDVNIYTTDKSVADKLNIAVTEKKCGE